MKYQLAVLALWLIALATTFLVVNDTSALTRLGPVFAICMIGSVLTVRAAGHRAQSQRGKPSL